MSAFDFAVLLVLALIVLFEARQEAGRALMDLVAVLAAIQLTSQHAPLLTGALHWKPLPGGDVPPQAETLCFALCLGAGLLVGRFLHHQTRWTMDTFDPFVGGAFGLLLAIALGHTVVDLSARMSVARHGALPEYIQDSAVADELRSFHSYHYVVRVLSNGQRVE